MIKPRYNNPSSLMTTMTMTTSSLRVLLLLLIAVVANSQQTTGEECTLCYDGSAANLELTIGGGSGGVKCSTLIEDVQGLSVDACLQLQMLGYTDCACPTYPSQYCSMCDNDFTAIPNPNTLIPGTATKCSDRLFVKTNETFTCDDAKKPGYVCGCPDAIEPTCNICGSTNSQPTEWNAQVIADGIGSYTCEELYHQTLLLELVAGDQCTSVQSVAKDVCKCTTNDDNNGSNSTPTSTTSDDTTLATNDSNTEPVVSDSTSSSGEGLSTTITTTATTLFVMNFLL